MLKKLLLISLIGLQGCTHYVGFFYWYEHSVNGRLPVQEITEEEEC